MLRPRDTIETLLKEVDYAKKLLGVDHVGIASDLFDLGDTTSIPTHKEFALVPAGLLSRGYSASDVEKIVGGNFMRLFKEVSASK